MTSINRFRILTLPLLLYVALQPALALDVTMRLVAGWSTQDQANVVLLLFFELTRGLRSLFALMLAGLLLGHSARRAEVRALILFIVLSEMAWAMAFAGAGYAGPFQEWLTRSLLDLGLSRGLLAIVFGYPDWALWLALAALLRFAVLFPQPLTPASVDVSGAHDRTGMMRGVPGAGIDIGASFRRLTNALVQRGWLDSATAWSVAGVGAALSIVVRHQSIKSLLWFPFGLGIAVVITCLRASYVSGNENARQRLLWIARGAAVALALFAAAGVAGLIESPAAAIGAFVLLTLAPAALLAGLAAAMLQRTRSENVAPVVS
jgi:hypothetical protein